MIVTAITPDINTIIPKHKNYVNKRKFKNTILFVTCPFLKTELGWNEINFFRFFYS